LIKLVSEDAKSDNAVKNVNQTGIEDVDGDFGKIVMKHEPDDIVVSNKLSLPTVVAAELIDDDDFLMLWGIREEVDPIVTDDDFQSHSDSDSSSSQQVHPFLSKLDEYFAL
jgi:hypothetical protein